MSIKSRMNKINHIADTTTLVYKRNKFHQVWYCDSVRTGKPYQVICDWSNAGGIKTLKVELFSYDLKETMPAYKNRPAIVHPANLSKTVCYQCLGVAKAMAKASGKVLSLCKSREAAENLLRFGGQLVNIVNLSGGSVWATVR